MPLQALAKDVSILRCINDCVSTSESVVTAPDGSLLKHNSTMVGTADWFAFMGFEPRHTTNQLVPIDAGHPAPNPTQFVQAPAFNASKAMPVRIFICSVCGYMELYYGPKTDPKTWGQ
jgi:hypothetical protein